MNKLFKQLVFLFVLLFSSVTSAVTIDKIVVFGDSLTDTGKFYALSQNTIPSSPPYHEGRFTDGPVWVEVLSQALNLPAKSLANYALGGSWAEPPIDSGELFPYDLATQVDYYLVDSIQDPDVDKHLFVFLIGANDYLRGRLLKDYATTNTVHHIEIQMDRLINQGARNFLILNLPSLGVTPYALSRGEDFIKMENDLTAEHNKKLDEMVKQKSSAFPAYKFVLFDLTYQMSDMLSNPEKFHLKDTTHACLSGLPGFHSTQIKNFNIKNNVALKIADRAGLEDSESNVCPNRQEYFFWDAVHPTEVIHRILGLAISEDLRMNGVEGAA